MKRWFAPCIVGMVLLYAALSVSAAGCLILQTEGPGHTHAHHAPSHSTHSSLCAWSCHANPTESIYAAVPLFGGVTFVAIQPLVNEVPEAFLLSKISRSRAPPAS